MAGVMKANIKRIRSMGRASILGRMEENTQEIGRMGKGMEGEDISWQMDNPEKGYGKGIKGSNGSSVMKIDLIYYRIIVMGLFEKSFHFQPNNPRLPIQYYL